MYSSTSSFRTELKVLLLVVSALAVCELVVRVFERRLTVDVKAPAISKRLSEAEGQRVLVLGNSLVRDNVNTDILETEMRAQGVRSIHIEKVYLMNTIVNDWYYAFKHHFVDAGRLPDVLVICFSYNHLEDATIHRPLIARYYSSLRDIPQIFSEDIPDFNGRVEFLLSRWLASFTHRTDVERRILDTLIPYYRESVTRINDALTDEANKRRGVYQPGYRRFAQLLRMAQNRGVRVIVVAVPVANQYPINPQIKSTLEANVVTFVDTRKVEGLGKTSFVDGMHMNGDGANVYSRALAHHLVDYLRPPSTTETFNSKWSRLIASHGL
ncbi:MAG TPA: hypothetical protein VF708_18670 [Pyrinomonadaceae bacterium]|jgi:hypothetical protein